MMGITQTFALLIMMLIEPAHTSPRNGRLILVCTPGPDTIQACEAKGGKFDTLNCKCVGRKPANSHQQSGRLQFLLR